jgi:hypothetical protein
MVVAGALFLCACSDPESFIDASPIRLYYRSGAQVCRGSANHLADVARRQAQFLGLPLPSRIDYHYVPTTTKLPCAVEAVGCYDFGSGEIWSWAPDQVHELVHAIVNHTYSYVVAFFNEGVAVALGGDNYGPPSYSLVPSAIENWTGSAEDYATAGDFVSYLLAQYGPQKLNALFKRIANTPQQLAEVSSAFEAVYGRSLSQAVAERRSSTLSLGEDRLMLPECGGDAAPWSASLSIDPIVACDSNGIGPTSRGDVFRYAAFDIVTDGFYEITPTAAPPGTRSIWLQQCGAADHFAYFFSDSPPNPFFSGSGPVVFARLSASRSFARFTRSPPPSVAGAAAFSIAVQPTSAAGADCGTHTPRLIDRSVGGVYVAPRQDNIPMLVAFQLDSDRMATGYSENAPIWLCAGMCAVDGTCTNITPTGAFTPISFPLKAGVTYTLVAQTPNSAAIGGVTFVQ